MSSGSQMTPPVSSPVPSRESMNAMVGIAARAAVCGTIMGALKAIDDETNESMAA